MTISTNNQGTNNQGTNNQGLHENSYEGKTAMKQAGGAFADGLTLIRFLLTPIIMTIIIVGAQKPESGMLGWPKPQAALFASALFIVAALTDIFDDFFGGAENAPHRKYGWFDDIADTVLTTGTLIALLYVIHKAGILGPFFAIPACIIIIREILVGLIRGYEMTLTGWPETRFGTLKTALTMFAVCVLLASPWLTAWYDMSRASDTNVVEIFDNPSTFIWTIGQGALWLAAIVSFITGFQLITGKSNAANDA